MYDYTKYKELNSYIILTYYMYDYAKYKEVNSYIILTTYMYDYAKYKELKQVLEKYFIKKRKNM